MRTSLSQTDSIYNITKTPVEEKSVREIPRRSQKAFDINDAKILKNEIDQSFKNTIGKLTIFDQRDEIAESVQSLANHLQPERPITPPDEDVTLDSIPRDVDQLIALIRRRLDVRRVPPPTSRLTSDDLSQLASVILTQMRSKWLDLEDMRVQHPLLTPKRNHELIRRLIVNIITICTNIFEHITQESQAYHDRYVFSHAANMTRLRTLLADKINTLINIHSLREHLAFEMIEEERLKKHLIPEDTNRKSPRKQLNKPTILSQHNPAIRDVIEQTGKSYRYRPANADYDSKQYFHQMMTSMPDITLLRRPPVLLPPMTRRTDSATSSRDSFSQSKSMRPKSAEKLSKSSLEKQEEKDLTQRILKRAKYGSLPNIHEKFLSEEFDFNFNNLKKLKYKTTDIIRERYCAPEKKKKDDKSAKPISNRDDLIKLTTLVKTDEEDPSDEISPLIKVLTSSHDTQERIDECKQTVVAIAKKRKKFLDEIKENARDEPLYPQPASIEKAFKNLTFRVSDITLANFLFQSTFLLTSFSTIFNNYFGDIDDDTTAYLDRNLHIGQQVKDVYEQLLTTIDTDLCFKLDMDTYVVQSPDRLNLPIAQASSTLTKPFVDQINNQDLAKRHEPPWVEFDNNRQRWIQTPDPRRIEEDAEAKKKLSLKNRNKGLPEPTVNMSLVPDPQLIASYKPRNPRQTRDFQLWKDYWTQVYTDNDYLKFLCTQSTDYLHHIFHLHDKLPEDTRLSEEDQALVDKRNRALKERDEKIAQLKERKNKFEQGTWNADSVFLGGLGYEPTLNPDDDPIVRFEQSLESHQPKSKRIDLFDPRAHEKAESNKRLLTTVLNNVKNINAQKRLEYIWKTVRMTDNDRLHMAVKYSTREYESKIEGALEAWESILQLIVRREKFINDLENFERTASDANRFFESGPMGASKTRLSESRRRTYLYNQLSILEKQITEQWNKIKTNFGDTVTYNGRNYLDKIQYDKLEMLHYLQEERRLNYLHSYTSIGKHSQLDSTFNHVL
ncbi:unnamed protein product [Adineta steineri]|uniref:Uncharacterized protein n=1 Tax=Adineta steineri TaxID=433720 RepID=A0A814EBR5_9BILA|nr:unnamed protein product [Adineta steineri]CAF0965657.1 unnamed protein product [Adineta steineri]